MVENALLFSRSHQDVADLAQPPLAPKRGAGGNYAGPGYAGRLSEVSVPTACQQHENEAAEVVIVCEPEGTSLMMGGLHPRCVQGACSLSPAPTAAQHTVLHLGSRSWLLLCSLATHFRKQLRC